MYQLNQQLDPTCKVDLYEHGHRSMNDEFLRRLKFIPNTISNGYVKLDDLDGITFCDANAKETSKRNAGSKSQESIITTFSVDKKVFVYAKTNPILFDAINQKKIDFESPKFKKGNVDALLTLDNGTFICIYNLWHANKTAHIHHFDYVGNTLRDKIVKLNEDTKLYCDYKFIYIYEPVGFLTLLDLNTLAEVKRFENISYNVNNIYDSERHKRTDYYFFLKADDKKTFIIFDKDGNFSSYMPESGELKLIHEQFNLRLFEKTSSKKIQLDGKDYEIDLIQYQVKKGESVIFETIEFEKEKKNSFKTIGYFPVSCDLLAENKLGIYFNSRFQFPNSKFGFFKSGYSVIEF